MFSQAKLAHGTPPPPNFLPHLSLVPRSVRAIQVNRGGLEPSVNFLDKFDRCPKTTGNEASSVFATLESSLLRRRF